MGKGYDQYLRFYQYYIYSLWFHAFKPQTLIYDIKCRLPELCASLSIWAWLGVTQCAVRVCAAERAYGLRREQKVTQWGDRMRWEKIMEEKSSCPGFHAVAHSCFCFIPDAHTGVALRLRARRETNERTIWKNAHAAFAKKVSGRAAPVPPRRSGLKCRILPCAGAAITQQQQQPPRPSDLLLSRDDEKALCFLPFSQYCMLSAHSTQLRNPPLSAAKIAQ